MQVTHCRVCAAGDLELFLDLGETALANRFLGAEQLAEPEPRFPLRLVLCRRCGLVQIDEEVPPEVLFKNYIYVSGTSDLVKVHAADLARHFTSTYRLEAGDLVLEAASNDGTVLRAFQQHGCRSVGIEPADNIASVANAEGVETICDFFGVAAAQRFCRSHGPARLFLGRHVLAHVADLRGFVAGMAAVLHPDGIAAVEVPHLLPFHDHLEYDTVYHEHLCYFSVGVLKNLFERFGLELIDVREAAIHGGSIVVTAQRRGGPWPVQARVARIIAREDENELALPSTWQRFARKVEHSRKLLLAELDRLVRRGCRLAGYGAPAKGMTLLSYCGLGKDRIPYLVDRSPHKQGLFTPGGHIPIDTPDRLLRDQPDVVLLLAWNFATEIARQQAEYLRRGGRLLLPIPSVHEWRGRLAA